MVVVVIRHLGQYITKIYAIGCSREHAVDLPVVPVIGIDTAVS